MIGVVVFSLFVVLGYWWIRPNYLFSRVRVTSYHVAHDLFEIEAALEYYYNDQQDYPPAASRDGRLEISSDHLSIGYIPGLITSCTPASTPELLLDLYSYRDKVSYRYGTNFKNVWVLISRGPDGKEDIDRERIEEFLITPESEYVETLASLTRDHGYDPTNGVISRGDIFRMSNSPGVRDIHKKILIRPNKYYNYHF